MLELTEYSNGIDDSLRVYNVLVAVGCRLFISALKQGNQHHVLKDIVFLKIMFLVSLFGNVF